MGVSTSQLQTSTGQPSARSSSVWVWAGFSLCALTAFSFFFIPVFIIRPFRYQSPRALWWAMALRQRAPLVTLIFGLACFALAFWLWKSVGRWRKALIVFALFIVSVSAVMSRLNHFEWMFHPVNSPEFIAQADSKLDAKEMILAVRMGGEDRAYPISQMAYHHIVNDEVGGVPIVATY